MIHQKHRNVHSVLLERSHHRTALLVQDALRESSTMCPRLKCVQNVRWIHHLCLVVDPATTAGVCPGIHRYRPGTFVQNAPGVRTNRVWETGRASSVKHQHTPLLQGHQDAYHVKATPNLLLAPHSVIARLGSRMVRGVCAQNARTAALLYFSRLR